jgi:hypothetical protein
MTDVAQGDPQWRAVLFDGDLPLATSRWNREWQHVEQLMAEWERRVATMSSGEVRSQAHRWNGE